MEKKIPKSVLAVMFVSVLSVCQTVPANESAKKEQWSMPVQHLMANIQSL